MALEAGLAGEVDQLSEVVVLLGEDGDLPLERHDQGLAGVLGTQGLEVNTEDNWCYKITLLLTECCHKYLK